MVTISRKKTGVKVRTRKTDRPSGHDDETRAKIGDGVRRAYQRRKAQGLPWGVQRAGGDDDDE